MKRTSESATWVLKMCRNFFFYFLIYVPFPLQKVGPARGARRREGSRSPSPAPGPRDFGVSGPSAPIPGWERCAGARGAAGCSPLGARARVQIRVDRAGGYPGNRTPKMGAGAAERPMGFPAAPSPNRHSRKLSLSSSDSNKSFMPVSTFLANFP